MQGLELPADPTGDDSLPQGGRLIGRLERAMILMLVLAGQPDGIGFLIAAKSLLRFNELARDQDRRASEYVIIGTLASFAWGLGAAFAADAALRRARPLRRAGVRHYLRQSIRIRGRRCSAFPASRR